MKFRNVNQVASWRLCVACGACASICPEKKIELFDIADDGIRPFLNSEEQSIRLKRSKSRRLKFSSASFEGVIGAQRKAHSPYLN